MEDQPMITEEIYDRILIRLNAEEAKLSRETAEEARKCADVVAKGERADQGELMCAYLREVGFGMAINRLVMIKSDECDHALTEMARNIAAQNENIPMKISHDYQVQRGGRS
jgi:hypothetical protein